MSRRIASASVRSDMRPAAAGSGIDPGRLGAFLRGGHRGADVGAGAAAGIDEAGLGEAVEGGVVAGRDGRLAQDRFGPGEAEPGEVVVDGRLVFRAAPGGVKVFDSQEKTPPAACAMSEAVRAEKAWPRCRRPVGDGAKRVTKGVKRRAQSRSRSSRRRVRRSSPD